MIEVGVVEEAAEQKAFLDDLEHQNRELDIIMRKRLPVVAGEPRTSCDSCTNPGCCSQKVITPFFEAMPIARQLYREGRVTPKLVAELRALGDAMDAKTRKGWFDAQHGCVFLTDDGKCSVYENRPFACRTYFALSPSENCQLGATAPVEFINAGDLLGVQLVRAHEINALFALRETRKRVYIGPLPRNVAIALEAWGMGPREATAHIRKQKWLSDTTLEDALK